MIRILVLCLLIAGFNRIYNLFFFENDLREKCPEIYTLRESLSETDIYYFGESSNVTFRENDSTKQSISELTGLFFPGLNITNINKYATHAGIYKHWLNEIRVSERPLKALIVTLNLRSFDAAWRHSELETSLQQSVVLSRPTPNIINRFLLSLEAFDNKTVAQREEDMLQEWRTMQLRFPFPFPHKTVAEWDYAMAQGTYTKPDGSWDTEKNVLACHYIKSYAFNLSEDNSRIKDFDEIADWCNAKNVKLYLNLMSENIEYADSLVGKELVFLMKQNRDFLVARYNKNGCKVVDNLEAVPGNDFIDQGWTTEHYGYRGRMKIASCLADSMKNDFINFYRRAY